MKRIGYVLVWICVPAVLAVGYLLPREDRDQSNQSPPTRSRLTSPSTSPAPLSVGPAPGATNVPSGLDLPVPGRVLIAFKSQHHIMGVNDSGTLVRLAEGQLHGSPLLDPTGPTLVFGRSSTANFGDLVALDLDTGRERVIGVDGTEAFAADGRLAQISAADDTDAEVELVIYSPRSLRETNRFRLGGYSPFAHVRSLAWADDDTLIVATEAGHEGTRVWRVGARDGRVHSLRLEPDWEGARVLLARGPAGAVAALRATDDVAELGLIRFDSDRLVFSGRRIHTRTAETAFEAYGRDRHRARRQGAATDGERCALRACAGR